MPIKSGKQCREKWHNHLNPQISNKDWKVSEDWLLFLLHKVYGNSWTLMAKFLERRSDNAIKNRWNSKMKKYLHGFQNDLDRATKLLRNNPLVFHETYPEIQRDLILQIIKENRVKVGSEFINNKSKNNSIYRSNNSFFNFELINDSFFSNEMQ